MGTTSEMPTWSDFLPGGPAASALDAGQGGLAGAEPEALPGRSGRGAARGEAGAGTAHSEGRARGDMEDGVLKEGFLVKRVSAPEHPRTLPAAGGCQLTWAGTSVSAPGWIARPGALLGRGPVGEESRWTGVESGLSIEKRGQGTGKEENPACLVRKGYGWRLPTEVVS